MGILDLVFPKKCLVCTREGKYLCPDCVGKISQAPPLCIYCKRSSIEGTTHTNCEKEYGLDGLISIWRYQGIIRKAILSLKYKYSTEVGHELTEYFIDRIKKLDSRFILKSSNVLTPIPLHWHKENVRGFNQSIEVGKKVATALCWKFIPNLLIKKQSTIPQAELGGEARRQNLKNVFVINPSLSSQTPHSVILFDDVFTTGSTLIEATKVLKRAGVVKVWGLTIAR